MSLEPDAVSASVKVAVWLLVLNTCQPCITSISIISQQSDTSECLQGRVEHGVMPELVDLARIQGVKGFRARQLYNAGLRTVRDVAESTVRTIEAVITNKGKPKHLHTKSDVG